MYQEFQSLILKKTNTIADAIRNLNKSGKQIILICEGKNRLIGTVTDGDIRKALVKEHSLEQKLEDVMNAQPNTSTVEENLVNVYSLMRKKGLRAMPVLDKKASLVGIHFIDEIVEELESSPTMLIMAGGFGSRMGKLTEKIPKPMLKVSGKPMLQHIIERAVQEKFGKIVISVHYLAEKIQQYFKDGEDYGISIEYINEEQPLGTGGSFKLVENIKGPVLVTNADIISNIGYRALLNFHEQNNASVTIATLEHRIQNQFGVIETSGIDFISFQEKPEWVTMINAGIYVVNSDARHLIAPSEFVSMPEIIQRVKDDGGRVLVYPLYENWVDLGSPEQYASYR